MAGAKSDIVDDSNLAVIVKTIEEKIGGETKLFISSADLLAAVNAELSWIDTHRKLNNQLKKFGLKPGRDASGDKRGFTITRAWVDDIKTRYIIVLPGDKASEASEGIENQQVDAISQASD
jgi:hypothetical protein